MSSFVCPKCKKKLANKIYCDELGHWHSICTECFGGEKMKAYCCECKKSIECETVKGDVIYPHRPDLYDLEFLQCPVCGNYTGKYDGEKAVLPTKHIRSCRYKAHRALDKIWKDRKQKSKYYKYMSDYFGRDFHWGEVECDEVADKALELTLDFLGGEE